MFTQLSKPQWHHIYYMLALFDVLVVLVGLYLTHQIITTFNDSVAVNLGWEQRLDRYLQLGEIAAMVNAPGNNVFDSHQVTAEAERTEAALQTFQHQMSELRTDAYMNLTPDQAAQLLKDLDAVDVAMNDMVAEANQIFAFFRKQQTGLAGARMASMDRKYHILNQTLTTVRKDVSVIQRNLFSEQQATALSLQRFEFVIAALVLVMISGAAYYGHKIRQQLEALERERQHSITELQAAEIALRQANDDLEGKVQARTAELANANVALQAEISERLRAEEELRQSEEQRRQAQKMEAVGRLAGGIAHDFNNILAAILGYSDLLLMNRSLNDSVQTRVRHIKEAGERAAELTKQLLTFGRKQILQPQPLDLNLLVIEVKKLLGRLVSEQIEIRTELDERVARIEADPSQIQQVLLNLAVNARDAMPQGGELIIKTEIVLVDTEFAQRYNGASAQRYVLLRVSDTGHGMDAETQAHIFEPFFTTKGHGKGVGLGLATVYGIVQQSGGFVRAQSEVGQGSSFEIYLPYTNKIIVNSAQFAVNDTPTPGTETLLLVEDDAAMRQMTSEALCELGYQVLEAANGAEAIALTQTWQEPLQLLVTDVIMPGMNGRQVAAELTRLRPDVRVLYMSGYTNEIIGQHGVLDSNTWFLQKPFSLNTLARQVREILDVAP